jgi:hypothetical protein
MYTGESLHLPIKASISNCILCLTLTPGEWRKKTQHLQREGPP